MNARALAGIDGLIVALQDATDVAEHGGKAVGLARLMQAGLPVPPGIVIANAALRRYFGAGDLTPGSERPDAAAMSAPFPAELSSRLGAHALEFACGETVAVRSSAAGEDGASASFAGQLDTVLGVDPAGELDAAVQRVWASRWSERALAYERHRNAPLSGMGVIVQRQIAARYAGVLFTVSPEAGREDEMLCEYVEGLGDRLVAGEVTPGRVAIARSTLAPTRKTDLASGLRPDCACIARLAIAARAAERLFGVPQDIEWAIDLDGKVWLLQSRPITAGSAAAAPALRDSQANHGGRPILWSNANVNENFPEPISPLLYSVAAAGYSSYFRELGKVLGVSARRLERMEPSLRSIIGVHAGRMYYNLTSIHAVLRAVPFGDVLARWFDDFVGAEGPRAGERRMRERARDTAELVRIAISSARQYRCLGARLEAFERSVDRYAVRTAPSALHTKTLLELRDDLRAFMDIRLRRWTGAGLCDTAALVCYGALKALLARAFPAVEHAQLHHDLLKGLDDLASAAPVHALWNLSRRIREDAGLRALFEGNPPDAVAKKLASDPQHAAFNADVQDYLERWGYRFSGELMLTVPGFQEKPGELLAILARYAAQDGDSPAERLARQRQERLAQTERVLAALRQRRLFRRVPGLSHAAIARPLIRAAQCAIGFRERARSKQALLYTRLRRVALEIGERLVREGPLDARDGVFYLTIGELDELLSGTAMFPQGARALVALRRRQHAAFDEVQPPDVMTAREGEYPVCGEAVRGAHTAGASLAGSSVCGGIVTGPARVLHSVAQACELARGDILVTRQTDPGWAPAFVAIGGLVLERGGMLSHGAILAREYGIPTIVGIADATSRIPDASIVRLDGDRGVVEIVR